MNRPSASPRSLTESSTPTRSIPPRARRGPRARIACVRCQRRKIRCDGAVPSCGSCLKVGADCVDGSGRQGGIETPRAYILSLKSRVSWLEGLLRANCPHIDLEQGPQIPHDASLDSHVAATDSGVGTANSPVSRHDTPGGQETPQSYTVQEAPSQSEHEPSQSWPNPVEPENLAHEIGLVSVSAGHDPKYVGPSSGYFFAKLVLAVAARQGQRSSLPMQLQEHTTCRSTYLLPQDSQSVPPTPLPSSMDYAIRLSQAYFDTTHLQYPFLHQPTHMKLIEKVYGQAEPAPVDAFQVNMVLAIAATVLSRRLKVSLSGEGFCANAMRYFDKIYIENSLRGLQSLLLLLLYTLTSPFVGLNVWYLNYQCLAALLDLGLQRDIKSSKTMSVLEQQMRRRVFWVIYTLDRTVATMMGRPIGLRDEACELTLPMDVEDYNLGTTDVVRCRQDGEEPTNMSSAIHLFKLAHMNSEVKYLLHSLARKSPARFAHPHVSNLAEWHRDMVSKLDLWRSEIPRYSGAKARTDRVYITILCEIKYHGLMTLLLRPSPGIPTPSKESLRLCYQHSVASIRLYDQLYKKDLMMYSWATVHAIFLATITMLYCIWSVPEVAEHVELEDLMADLKSGSNVLSATGEHWPEAKRSIPVLDGLSSATIRWIVDFKTKHSQNLGPENQNVPTPLSLGDGISNGNARVRFEESTRQTTSFLPIENFGIRQEVEYDFPLAGDFASTNNQYFGSDFYTSLFGDNTLVDQIDFSNPTTVNNMMQGLFTDLQPTYDFGQVYGGLDQVLANQN